MLLRGAGVFTLYLAVAMLYRGRFALAGPGRGTLGTGPDVQIFIWGLRWWPYAVQHGLDPFVSHLVWSPYGADVLWSSTVPALSLLAAPLTMTAGATVTWNILVLLAPVLSGCAAYALCRELTGKVTPALLGGGLFAFSSYELAEGTAHLHVTMTLLVPLGVLVVIRYVRCRMAWGGMTWRLAAIVVVQFFISPEVLLTMLFMGVLTVVAAAALMPERRPRLRRVACGGAVAVGTALLVLAPALVVMVRDQPAAILNSSPAYAADLLNLVVPTAVTGLGGAWASTISTGFHGNLAEQSAYLGLPLLGIVASFAITRRAGSGARLLLFMLAASVVLSLGPRLTTGGQPTIWLPGALISDVPLLGDALPARFALYTTLAAAVIVSLWLAEAPSWRRWLAAGAAAACLAPASSAALWWKPTPRAVRLNQLAHLVRGGSTVISLPFGSVDDRGLLAQVAANMRFNIVDGWLQIMPSRYRIWIRSLGLSARRVSRSHVATLERGLCDAGVDYAVVWNDRPSRSSYLAALNVRPEQGDHLLVYRIPGCGPPAASRRPGTWVTDGPPTARGDPEPSRPLHGEGDG